MIGMNDEMSRLNTVIKGGGTWKWSHCHSNKNKRQGKFVDILPLRLKQKQIGIQVLSWSSPYGFHPTFE
jgi:hypothetical protein